MFSTNVIGLINMTQAVLPTFKARDEGGRGDIINIGSIAGREAYPGGSIYCASKAAVRTFTDSLRRELVATRIRIMEVDPGQVETVAPRVSSFGQEEMTDDEAGILYCSFLRGQSQSRRSLCVGNRKMLAWVEKLNVR